VRLSKKKSRKKKGKSLINIGGASQGAVFVSKEEEKSITKDLDASLRKSKKSNSQKTNTSTSTKSSSSNRRRPRNKKKKKK